VPHWLVELRGIEQASAEATPGHTPTVVELTVANSTGVIAAILGGRLGPRRAGREPVVAGAAGEAGHLRLGQDGPGASSAQARRLA
jgi:hypothetical protein